MRHFMMCCVAALSLTAAVGAGEYGQHYYSGTEGLKAGSLLDPGFSVNLRTTYYYANRWHDNGGHSSYFKREVFFAEPEFAWTSENPILLGARYEARIALPLPYHQEDMAVDNDKSSREHFTMKVGDLRVTPITLGWDFDRFELTAGYTFFAPVGRFDYEPSANPALKADEPNPGKGYWTHMLNLGGTFYFDDNRSWSLSAMTHYEFHTRQDDSDIRYGQNLHFEGGVGKEWCSGWKAGAVFYGSYQTTDNDYKAGRDNGSGNRVFAGGLEAGYNARSGKLPWFATIRGLREFGAKGNTEGYRTLLTAGLRF